MNPSDLIIPLLLAGAAACGTGRRVNVYAALTRGAEDGLTVLLHVIPALVGLLTAVSMFRASGAMDALAQLCAPVLNLLGIPAETVPLMLVRPVSGSGALAVASDLMASHGPDSYIGRVAAVMLGSTETTFYTIAVYFGSAGIVRTRHTVPAALAADLTGFLTSCLAPDICKFTQKKHGKAVLFRFPYADFLTFRSNAPADVPDSPASGTRKWPPPPVRPWIHCGRCGTGPS